MNEHNEELGMFVLFPTHYLEQMTCRQAVLMGMLIGMAKKSGYAYPSNKTISKILNMTVITVQRELSILEEKGFLTRQLIRDESNQIVSRRLYPHIKSDTTLISELILPSYQNCYSNKDNTISIKDKVYDDFENCWGLYQKKGIKQSALKSYNKLRQDEKDLLLEFIPKYIQNHIDADKLEFLPHFSTFINQKRWNDELPYKKKIDKIDSSQQISNKKAFNLNDYE